MDKKGVGKDVSKRIMKLEEYYVSPILYTLKSIDIN